MLKKYVAESVVNKLREEIKAKIDLLEKYVDSDSYELIFLDKEKILQKNTFISFKDSDELKTMFEWADAEGLQWNSCENFMDSFDEFSSQFLYRKEAINFNDGVWGSISEFKKEFIVLTFNDVILK